MGSRGRTGETAGRWLRVNPVTISFTEFVSPRQPTHCSRPTAMGCVYAQVARARSRAATPYARPAAALAISDPHLHPPTAAFSRHRIKGLFKLLQESVPGCIKERTIGDYNGRKLAIDASMASLRPL